DVQWMTAGSGILSDLFVPDRRWQRLPSVRVNLQRTPQGCKRAATATDCTTMSSSLRGAAAVLVLLIGACTTHPEPPSARVHYLGHAAFLLTFDNGVKVLTDFGESRAYGLDSPVHGFGTIRPDVITISHDHADHAGGELPERIGRVLRDGEHFEGEDLKITPIATYERTLEESDNTSYVFDYRGVKILHLGDCQALMLGLAQPDVRDRVRQLYPESYDLVLLPIGFVSDILAEAVEFITLLDAQRVIPMHYWDPSDRDAFLRLIDGRADSWGRIYRSRSQPDAAIVLGDLDSSVDTIHVIGLTPAPLTSMSGSTRGGSPPGGGR
ncbi:MAG: MBL fold metallo-hydrolase, partial [Gemmatimonadota bacterium]